MYTLKYIYIHLYVVHIEISKMSYTQKRREYMINTIINLYRDVVHQFVKLHITRVPGLENGPSTSLNLYY